MLSLKCIFSSSPVSSVRAAAGPPALSALCAAGSYEEEAPACRALCHQKYAAVVPVRSLFILCKKHDIAHFTPGIDLHFSASSQEELQQRNHTGNSWAKRRGWRGADSHQGLPQVSDHFPTHPASSSGPRLQAHTGERMRGLTPDFYVCALNTI